MKTYQNTQRATAIIGFLSVTLLGMGIFALVYHPLVFPMIGLVLSVWIFRSLTVEISETELMWYFGPGWPRKRVLLSEVASVEVIRTTFLNGWGIHYTPHGWLYNVSGYGAVAIKLRSGNKDELSDVMTPTKLKIGIISSLVVIGLAAWLATQQQSQNTLREKNRALQEQVDQFTQRAADNQANTRRAAPSFSDAQTSELLRLRNEVGRLRVQSNELANLRAALATEQKVQSGKPASAPTQSEPIPKGAWTNAGYATPEAAFQTICFAMSKGDLQTYLNSLSPEQQTNMMKVFQTKSDAEIAAGQMAEMEPVNDFQVVGKIEVGPDQVQMLVHTAGEDLNTIFIMTNVDGSWRFANMVKEN